MQSLTIRRMLVSGSVLAVALASAFVLRSYLMREPVVAPPMPPRQRVVAAGGTEVHPHVEEDPVIDQNAQLVERDAYYKVLPARDIQAGRLEDQAKLLKEFEKDPEAFVNRYAHEERTFLFDAVIDARNMVRIGTFSDGGKWLSELETLKPGSVVYSFGVGQEISFDTEMAGRFGCDVHCFDPTPSVERAFAKSQPGQPIGKGKFWFHAVGLGPTSLDTSRPDELLLEGRKCPVKRLSELADELGHKTVEILKVDIEGGEMAALSEILASGTLEKLSVKQILVEFHLWDDEHFKPFVRLIGQLREHGYLLFRKEFNPLDASRCAEFCFIRTK